MKNIVVRTCYFDKLKLLKDSEIIKVITGIRRCGKSTLLAQFMEYLKTLGVAANQLIFINFEDKDNESLKDKDELYKFVTTKLIADKQNYVFFDEIQQVKDYQIVVDSLQLKKNVDIYITGSNSYFLSSDLATLLSGRYIEIKMLPFSFAEYFEFVKSNNKRSVFNEYFRFGGMPYAVQIKDTQIKLDYLENLLNTVLINDVVERHRVSDIALLRTLLTFIFDNIGKTVSPKKIADTLTSNGRKVASSSIDNYLEYFSESLIIHKVSRYDIKGKEHLKSLAKYYVTDWGFRNLFIGGGVRDVGSLLENIVYLELLRRDYQVFIGKLGDTEIDFIAEKDGQRIYYQVAASVLDPSTFEREMRPLKKIKDNYPKVILTMDELPLSSEGIECVNVVGFLLGNGRKIKG